MSSDILSRFGFESRGTEDGTAGRKGDGRDRDRNRERERERERNTERKRGWADGAGFNLRGLRRSGVLAPISEQAESDPRWEAEHNDLDADAATTKYRCGNGSGTELGTLSQSLVDIRTEEQGTKLGGFIS